MIPNKAIIALNIYKWLSETEHEPVPISDLAIVTGVSASYIEQITPVMLRLGLVRSYRGPGGGYSITDRDISLMTLVDAYAGKPKHKKLYALVLRSLDVSLKEFIND